MSDGASELTLGRVRAMLELDLLAGPDAPDGVKLRADALPASTWGSNLRGILSATKWDRLRIPVCEAAGNRCQICGRAQRPGKRPDCHEQWVFELPAQSEVLAGRAAPVQRLARLVALCKDCHRVQHIGLAGIRGEMDQVKAHLASVNGWPMATVVADLNRAQTRHAILEAIAWDLDLGSLAGQIEIPGFPTLLISAGARDHLGNSGRKRRRD